MLVVIYVELYVQVYQHIYVQRITDGVTVANLREQNTKSLISDHQNKQKCPEK